MDSDGVAPACALAPGTQIPEAEASEDRRLSNRLIDARVFDEEAARVLGRPLRTRAVPTWRCTLWLGPVVTEYATAHTHFSNAKLRATGFDFRYPSYRDGPTPVVERWPARMR